MPVSVAAQVCVPLAAAALPLPVSPLVVGVQTPAATAAPGNTATPPAPARRPVANILVASSRALRPSARRCFKNMQPHPKVSGRARRPHSPRRPSRAATPGGNYRGAEGQSWSQRNLDLDYLAL